MPIFIKAEEKMCLAQPKTRSKRAIFMDRKRSINQNAHSRLNYYRWADGELRKYP